MTTTMREMSEKGSSVVIVIDEGERLVRVTATNGARAREKRGRRRLISVGKARRVSAAMFSILGVNKN